MNLPVPAPIHLTAWIHPMAHIGDNVTIGARTRVWQFASVIRGTRLGDECSIAASTIVDAARVGDRCIISAFSAVGPGALLGDDVFVGPHVIFANDMWPQVDKTDFDLFERIKAGELCCRVEDGASIGAHAVILPGISIGAKALIAAAVVVDRDVPKACLFRRDGRIVPVPPHRERMRFVEKQARHE